MDDEMNVEKDLNDKTEEIKEENTLKEDSNDESTNEKNNDNRTKKRSVIKIILITIVAILVLAVGIISFKIYSEVENYSDKVYPGITLYGESLSGLTHEELVKRLDSVVTTFVNNEISIIVNDKEFITTYEELGGFVAEDKLAEAIFNYGKSETFFNKYKLIKEPVEKNFDFRIFYDEKKLDDFINKISKAVKKKAKNADISISYNGKIDITDDIKGSKLDKDNLKIEIQKILDNPIDENLILIEGKVSEVEAEITKKDLKNVNSKISSYTTYYPGGPSGTNIEVSTKYVDDVLLMPGEEFSALGLIGYTTPDKGYVLSNTYVNGKVVKDYGGGVCQLASTIYNAELRAGIIPEERLYHMMPVTYVPLGLDATLADDAIDLRFKNPYDYPIVINAYAGGGQVTVEIWSKKDVLNGIKYVPQSYSSGLSASTYLYGYDKDGNLVYEEYIDSSTYMPLP